MQNWEYGIGFCFDLLFYFWFVETNTGQEAGSVPITLQKFQ
jgi:hypothetical protein